MLFMVSRRWRPGGFNRNLHHAAEERIVIPSFQKPQAFSGKEGSGTMLRDLLPVCLAKGTSEERRRSWRRSRNRHL
jgi:hypothetical protein